MIANTRLVALGSFARNSVALAAFRRPAAICASARDQRPSFRVHVAVAARSSHVLFTQSAMSDWPCKPAALTVAKEFLHQAVENGGKIVLAPDRDADGLCAGKQTLPYSYVCQQCSTFVS